MTNRFLALPALMLAFAGHLLATETAAGIAPGITISPDDPLFIQHAVDAAYKAGLHKIVIPPGIYRIGVATGPGPLLHFDRMKDFEIDATGVTLINTNRSKDSISFGHCENVTFRGATLIRDPVPFSQGRIIARSADGKSIDIQVAKGYPTDVDDKHFFPDDFVDLYRPSDRQWQADAFGPPNSSFAKLGPDSFRFKSAQYLDTHAGWAVGAAVAWRGRGGPDIAIDGGQDMKIIGVTIESGSGFCVREAGGEGHNYYNYTVTYGPTPPGATEEPLLASNADGFHSVAVRHGPTLENCHFEGMNDDGIPIHGVYALVQEADANDVIVESLNPPFCQPGDLLHFYDPAGVIRGEARVAAVANIPYIPKLPPPKYLRRFQKAAHPGYQKLTLDQPVPAQFAWLVANADANGAGFVIRGCTVRNNRARGMLIKASDGLIENCTVEGSSMGGIVVSPEASYWNEADYSRRLIIRHNILRNDDYWQQPGAVQTGALTIAAFEQGRFVPLPGGHRNIVVEDNVFENDNGTNLLVTSAENVVIRNNRFVHPMESPSKRGSAVKVDPTALIWLTDCSGVQLQGNLLVDPGPYLKTDVGTTPTASGTGFKDGVALAPAP